jgi:hypothetical protein
MMREKYKIVFLIGWFSLLYLWAILKGPTTLSIMAFAIRTVSIKEFSIIVDKMLHSA